MWVTAAFCGDRYMVLHQVDDSYPAWSKVRRPFAKATLWPEKLTTTITCSCKRQLSAILESILTKIRG